MIVGQKYWANRIECRYVGFMGMSTRLTLFRRFKNTSRINGGRNNGVRQKSKWLTRLLYLQYPIKFEVVTFIASCLYM